MVSEAVLEVVEKSSTKVDENIFGGSRVLITGRQIRMARAALRWSAHDLAKKTGVGYGAVQRAESGDGVPVMITRNLAAIEAALKQAGIVFIDGEYAGSGGPGVRLRQPE